MEFSSCEFIRLRSSSYDGTRRMGSILQCFLPCGKAGELQILCCQRIAVNYYSFTLDALALKLSDFCNVRVRSKLKPLGKAEVIKQYQSRDMPVMFVGDGINDAPALASSQVGVAMGAVGTEVALETADVALTHDDISKLPWLLRLSKRMLRIIKIKIDFFFPLI